MIQKVLKVSRTLLTSKFFRFLTVRMCPIHIVQEVTEITKFIGFEIASQLKGLCRHQFVCNRKVLSRSKRKFSALYFSMTHYHISSALIPYSSQVSFSKRKTCQQLPCYLGQQQTESCSGTLQSEISSSAWGNFMEVFIFI